MRALGLDDIVSIAPEVRRHWSHAGPLLKMPLVLTYPTPPTGPERPRLPFCRIAITPHSNGTIGMLFNFWHADDQLLPTLNDEVRKLFTVMPFMFDGEAFEVRWVDGTELIDLGACDEDGVVPNATKLGHNCMSGAELCFEFALGRVM